MQTIIDYINETIIFVKHHNPNHPDNILYINILTKDFEGEELSNLLGLCLLFDRQDWLETITEASELDLENREKALDSLIVMKIPNYPITEQKKLVL